MSHYCLQYTFTGAKGVRVEGNKIYINPDEGESIVSISGILNDYERTKNLNVYFCNSRNTLLVRAADIIANRIYHLCVVNELGFAKLNNFTVFYFPL